MLQSNQEYTARRFSPDFDCQLPPEVRSEFLQPRRPRILTQPPGPPQKPPQVEKARSWRHPALGWLLALAAVVAVVAVSWPSPEKRAKALQESVGASREAEAKALSALKN